MLSLSTKVQLTDLLNSKQHNSTTFTGPVWQSPHPRYQAGLRSTTCFPETGIRLYVAIHVSSNASINAFCPVSLDIYTTCMTVLLFELSVSSVAQCQSPLLLTSYLPLSYPFGRGLKQTAYMFADNNNCRLYDSQVCTTETN